MPHMTPLAKMFTLATSGDLNYGRLRGQRGYLASDRLTPDLIRKARKGRKLEWLILESCGLGSPGNAKKWKEVAKGFSGHIGDSYPKNTNHKWGDVQKKLPKVIGGGSVIR